jgi:hypothetical protein
MAIAPAAPGRAQGTTTTGEQFAGTWSGTWDSQDGSASGGFELTLEKIKDGVVAGRVSVTGEPTYKATFKSLSFDGTKMTARYEFPPDQRADVLLVASFEGNKAKGTWSLREKNGDTEVVTGTWTVTKK